MEERPSPADLPGAGLGHGATASDAVPWRAGVDEFDIEHLNDKPFEPIPDPILYMFSLFRAA